MITFIEVKRNCGGSDKMLTHMRGLSTDTKPTSYCNGSEFFEMDTQKTYYFNEATGSWIESSAPSVTAVSITAPPTKTEYVEGQAFDATGAIITLALSDSSTVECDATSPLTRPLTTEDVRVPLECIYNGVSYGALQAIEVAAKAVATLMVSKAPDKVVYKEGQTLTMAGLKLGVTYNDGSETVVDYGEEGITYDPAEGIEITQDETIQITYGGKTCTQDITYDGGETE